MSNNLIPPGAREIYISDSGNDGNDGRNPNFPKLTLSDATTTASALTPTTGDPVAIIDIGLSTYSENLVIPDNVFINLLEVRQIGLDGGTVVTAGANARSCFSSVQTSNVSGAVAYSTGGKSRIGFDAPSIVLNGDDQTAIQVNGTTSQFFSHFSQILMITGTDGCTGLHYTSSGDPSSYVFDEFRIDGENSTAILHDTTNDDPIELRGGSIVAPGTGNVGINVADGVLTAYINSIEAPTAITVAAGATANIFDADIIGDITVAAGGTLNCTINSFTGVLTNNGTINGKIENTTFGDQTLVANLVVQGTLGVGITPDASAILHIQSASKGFLGSAMTDAEADNIPNPADGLQIINITDEALNVFFGGSKEAISTHPTTEDNIHTGSPIPAGGSNTQVQYNNNGVFGGISGITTDGTILLVSGRIDGDGAGGLLNLTGADSATDAGGDIFVTGGNAGAIGGGGNIVNKSGDASGAGEDSGQITIDTGTTVSGNVAPVLIQRAAGNVGIGVTVPDGKLHVASGSAGATGPSSFADDLIVENSGDTGIAILSPDASFSAIEFGSPSRQTGAQVKWKQSTGNMVIGTAEAGAKLNLQSGLASTGLTLDENGNVEIVNTLLAGSIISESIEFGDASTVNTGVPLLDINWSINILDSLQVNDLSAETTNQRGLFISRDGLKLYVADQTTQTAFEYDLAKPWDTTIAPSYTGNNIVLGSNMTSFFLKDDGTVAYFGDFAGDFREYLLSTPFDLSTAGSPVFTGTAATVVVDVRVHNNGTDLFNTSSTGVITHWTMSIPWDLSTLTDTGVSFATGLDMSSGGSIAFRGDGRKLIIIASGAAVINEYSLDIPWDISTLRLILSKPLAGGISELAINPQGDKLFTMPASGSQDLVEYAIGIVTSSLVTSFVLTDGLLSTDNVKIQADTGATVQISITDDTTADKLSLIYNDATGASDLIALSNFTISSFEGNLDLISASDTAGSNLSITSGDGSAGNGGDINSRAGDGAGSGGALNNNAGDGTFSGGDINHFSGSVSGTGVAGTITSQAGQSGGSSKGGAIHNFAGIGGDASGEGGDILSHAGAGGGPDGKGGTHSIEGGQGASGGNSDGGNVEINGGPAFGTGTKGLVLIDGLVPARLNPDQVDIFSAEDLDKLATAGVITVADGAQLTLDFKSTIVSSTRIVIEGTGRFKATGTTASGTWVYSGTDDLLSGAGSIAIRNIFLVSVATGTLLNIVGGVSVAFTSARLVGWDDLGSVSGLDFLVCRAVIFADNSLGFKTDDTTVEVSTTLLIQGGITGPLVDFRGSIRPRNAFISINSGDLATNLIRLDPAIHPESSLSINNNVLSTGGMFDTSGGATGTFASVSDAAISLTTIDSVTVSSGVARFNFTVGPTMFVNQEVDISNFVTETSYNQTGIITATGAGFFEVDSIAFTADDATGDFSSDSVTMLEIGTALIDGDTLVIDTVAGTQYDGGATVYNQLVNSFQINRIFSISRSGTWDTAGIDQTDPRILANNNPGFASSKYIAAAFVNNNSTANPSIVNNTFSDMAFGTGAGGLIDGSNMERWKLINSVTGIFEYTGNEPFDGFLNYDFTSLSSGSAQEFRFKFLKDTGSGFAVLPDDVESLVDVGSTASSTSKSQPITANKGDQIKPQVTRNDGSGTLTTSYASINAVSG